MLNLGFCFLQAIPIIILVRHSIMIGEMAMKYTLGDIQLKKTGYLLAGKSAGNLGPLKPLQMLLIYRKCRSSMRK